MTIMKQSKIALEDEISRMIMSDNGCTAHFDYSDSEFKPRLLKEGTKRKIIVLTYNSIKKETFLFKEVEANNDEEGLKEILNYAKSHKDDYDSFTIVWTKKGVVNSSEKSYFYCKDLLEALEKFYFNKTREDYLIYEAKMNPRT